MQCWNCGFENLPGLGACGRCASRLNLAGVAVEPPRASRLGVATAVIRAGNTVVAGGRHLRRLGRLVSLLTPQPVCWPTVAWSVLLPGLGQIRQRHTRVQGWTILSAWLVLLALVMLSIATELQWVFLMLMVAVHGIAVLAALAGNLAYERLAFRLAFGLILFVTLDWGLYRPVRWFGGRFARTVVVRNVPGKGPLRAGDGLLTAGPWLRQGQFQRGDLILYEIHAAYGDHQMIRAGQGVDRIVGVPGDRIHVTADTVLINGNPPRPGEGPLTPNFPPGELELTLLPGQYAVIPSQMQWGTYGELPQPWMLYAGVVVDYPDIVGRVLWRVRPLSRYGPLK